jgi:hypothetical protein
MPKLLPTDVARHRIDEISDRSPPGKWTTFLAGYAVIAAILLGGNPAGWASGLVIFGVVILVTAETKALHRDQVKRDADLDGVRQALARLPQLLVNEMTLKEEKAALLSSGEPTSGSKVLAVDEQIATNQRNIIEVTTTIAPSQRGRFPTSDDVVQEINTHRQRTNIAATAAGVEASKEGRKD